MEADAPPNESVRPDAPAATAIRKEPRLSKAKRASSKARAASLARRAGEAEADRRELEADRVPNAACAPQATRATRAAVATASRVPPKVTRAQEARARALACVRAVTAGLGELGGLIL